MARSSNREKLLTEGLRLVHSRGFGASSVRDIVHAAGVPQGSFTNHFTSKEAFGVEVLERYHALISANVARTLRNDESAPVERLKTWLSAQVEYLRQDDMRKGCLYGNLSAEASEESEAIRTRVVAAIEENEASVGYCLRAAVDAGELAKDTDVDDIAAFIIASLQGAILVSKVKRQAQPFERFMRILFDVILAPR